MKARPAGEWGSEVAREEGQGVSTGLLQWSLELNSTQESWDGKKHTSERSLPGAKGAGIYIPTPASLCLRAAPRGFNSLALFCPARGSENTRVPRDAGWQLGSQQVHPKGHGYGSLTASVTATVVSPVPGGECWAHVGTQ